jgi:hypothetical protein
MLEAPGHGAEAAGHGAGIEHQQHRHAEATRQFGGRGFAVVQAHHAFDQDQVGIARRARQAPARIGLAAHAEVDVLAGAAAAMAWICGSRKSGPHLKTRTRRPWRRCRRASAATTVVLPWPEAGAATSNAGQRTAFKTPSPAWP